MPLFPRRVEDHYPDENSVHADHVVVLCGGLEVGGWHRVTSGPSGGGWQWGVSITASLGFGAGGRATSPDECKAHIAAAFRKMVARADLRERADAKPGLPRRAPWEASIEPPEPSRPYHAEDHYAGPMVRNELSRIIRSGELHVGVLTRASRGAERWSWFLTGLQRPDDPDFVWQGTVDTEAEVIRCARAVLVPMAVLGRAGTSRQATERRKAAMSNPPRVRPNYTGSDVFEGGIGLVGSSSRANFLTRLLSSSSTVARPRISCSIAGRNGSMSRSKGVV
jgi:hypothetical protein